MIRASSKKCVLYIVVLAFLGFLACNKAKSPGEATALIGTTAQPLRFSDRFNTDGQWVSPRDYSAARLTIVNFWATWCNPCIREMPMLDSFYRANKGSDIALIGFTQVNLRAEDRVQREKELQKIEGMIRTLKVTYPVLVSFTPGTTDDFRVDELPTTVLIDRRGRILEYAVGMEGTRRVLERAGRE